MRGNTRRFRISKKSYLLAGTLTGALLVTPLALGPDTSTPLVASVAYAAEEDNSQTVTAPDGASVTALKVLESGQAIEIQGNGWIHPEGKGSKVTVKADKGQTTRDGKDILASVEADPTGHFTLTLDFPSQAHGYDSDWLAGSTHTLNFLTGSAQQGDPLRSLAVQFTVAPSPDSGQPQPVDTSGWTSLKAGDASLLIRPFQKGQKLRVRGQGWVNTQQTSGSVVAIKLASGRDSFFERDDNTVQNTYLKSLGLADLGEDRTIWALLTSDSSVANPAQGIYLIQPDGSFDLELDVPPGLESAQPGDYLAVQALSGRFAPGDVRRSARSEPIPVNGVAYQEAEKKEQTQCHSDVESPRASIPSPSVEAGGKLHLVGSGWCNPQGRGAPRIAVKIDDASISRKDTRLHSNKTIWAIIEPNQSTGEIDSWIQLPAADGSDSDPGLSEGAHSLRLLAGSLQAGDLRTSYGGVGVLDFVVGRYAPTAVPDTVSDADLTPETQKGVQLSKDGLDVVVTVPAAQPGQWVRVNPYLGGSIRSMWGSNWVQLDENRQVSYRMPEELAPGDYRFVVQSGEQNDFGSLLGWAAYTVPETEPKQEKMATTPLAFENSEASSAGSLLAVVGESQSSFATSASSNSGILEPEFEEPASTLAQVVKRTERIVRFVPKKLDSVQATQVQKKVRALPAKEEANEKGSAPGSGDDGLVASSEDNPSHSLWSSLFSPNNLLLLLAAGLLVGVAVLPRKQ